MIRWTIRITIAAVLVGLLVLWADLSKEVGVDVHEGAGEAAEYRKVLVSVEADGAVELDGQSIAISELAERVAALIDGTSGDQGTHGVLSFVISVDQETDNVLLLEVMDALNRGGAIYVSLETDTGENGL